MNDGAMGVACRTLRRPKPCSFGAVAAIFGCADIRAYGEASRKDARA